MKNIKQRKNKKRKLVYNKELDIEKKVKEEDLLYYLNNEYRLGRRPFTDEAKENIRKAQKNSEAHLGRRQIYKNNKEKKVKKEELLYYLEQGWKLGRAEKTKQK